MSASNSHCLPLSWVCQDLIINECCQESQFSENNVKVCVFEASKLRQRKLHLFTLLGSRYKYIFKKSSNMKKKQAGVYA